MLRPTKEPKCTTGPSEMSNAVPSWAVRPGFRGGLALLARHSGEVFGEFGL